ncbi:hypothetical protein RIEPE_0094 [Candidatus Riesia pediculicola USDA]|uniref:Uncharacterized protein n=1 Tax=Riesia pediculicola (strain USDA) TaxID=515618 RepID=D4G7Q5_RIEPU|nr:hypothetical protein RIEPE_0094 [Candidatus Riesia pediculicola USDA]
MDRSYMYVSLYMFILETPKFLKRTKIVLFLNTFENEWIYYS